MAKNKAEVFPPVSATNDQQISYPYPAMGPPPAGLCRAIVSGGKLLRCVGSKFSNSAPIRIVTGKVFSSAGDIPALPPDPPGSSGYTLIEYTVPGGVATYTFENSGGTDNRLSGAQLGENNFVGVWAQFEGSLGTWIPAKNQGRQFFGVVN